MRIIFQTSCKAFRRLVSTEKGERVKARTYARTIVPRFKRGTPIFFTQTRNVWIRLFAEKTLNARLKPQPAVLQRFCRQQSRSKFGWIDRFRGFLNVARKIGSLWIWNRFDNFSFFFFSSLSRNNSQVHWHSRQSFVNTRNRRENASSSRHSYPFFGNRTFKSDPKIVAVVANVASKYRFNVSYI